MRRFYKIVEIYYLINDFPDAPHGHGNAYDSQHGCSGAASEPLLKHF